MQPSAVSPELAEFLGVMGALGKLVVLSIILERGLAYVFEHDWYRAAFTKVLPDPQDPTKQIRESRIPGLRGTLALGVSLIIGFIYRFDVLGPIFGETGVRQIGIVITAVVVAGGSAGAIAIFQGVLNFNRDAREARLEANKAEAENVKAATERKRAEIELQKAEFEFRKSELEAQKLEADLRKAATVAVSLGAVARPAPADPIQ
jgi:hypothetical protein